MKAKFLLVSLGFLIAPAVNAALIITTLSSPFTVLNGGSQNINLNSDLGSTGDTTTDLSITVTDLSMFGLGKALGANRAVSGATGSFASFGSGSTGNPLAIALPLVEMSPRR